MTSYRNDLMPDLIRTKARIMQYRLIATRYEKRSSGARENKP